MKTFEDLVVMGEQLASPNYTKYRTWYIDSTGNADLEEKMPLYYVYQSDYNNLFKIPDNTITIKPGLKFFIVSDLSTPAANIKAYIQQAKGKITKDIDKADHVIIDESINRQVCFERAYDFIHTDGDKALIVTRSTYVSSYYIDKYSKLMQQGYSYSAEINFYRVYQMAALAVCANYSSKIIRPYDLGVAAGSITPLTEDNIESITRMFSGTSDDRELANQMLATFDYKKNLYLTWKLVNRCSTHGHFYYFNKRLKSVRDFIDNYYDKWSYYSAENFFNYLKMRELLTPEIFANLYKDVQKDIKVLGNAGIYTVKFEMKPEYKELLKQHANEINQTCKA